MKIFECECDQLTELDPKELSNCNGGTWFEFLTNGITWGPYPTSNDYWLQA